MVNGFNCKSTKKETSIGGFFALLGGFFAYLTPLPLKAPKENAALPRDVGSAALIIYI
jgi:hypothetical protein